MNAAVVLFADTPVAKFEIDVPGIGPMPIDLFRFGIFTIGEALVEKGKIDPRGKSPKQLIEEMTRVLRKDRSLVKDVHVIADHTEAVLHLARQYRRSEDLELSCLFYVMWFEHTINRVLVTIGGRRGLSRSEVDEIIRRTAIRDKTTWVLRLLQLPQINRIHVRRINAVEEIRNSYTHFKWKPEPDDHDTKAQAALSEIEKSVNYVSRYVNRWIYAGNKRGVKGAFGRSKRRLEHWTREHTLLWNAYQEMKKRTTKKERKALLAEVETKLGLTSE